MGKGRKNKKLPDKPSHLDPDERKFVKGEAVFVCLEGKEHVWQAYVISDMGGDFIQIVGWDTCKKVPHGSVYRDINALPYPLGRLDGNTRRQIESFEARRNRLCILRDQMVRAGDALAGDIDIPNELEGDEDMVEPVEALDAVQETIEQKRKAAKRGTRKKDTMAQDTQLDPEEIENLLAAQNSTLAVHGVEMMLRNILRDSERQILSNSSRTINVGDLIRRFQENLDVVAGQPRVAEQLASGMSAIFCSREEARLFNQGLKLHSVHPSRKNQYFCALLLNYSRVL